MIDEMLDKQDVLIDGTIAYCRHPADEPFSPRTAIIIEEDWDSTDDIPKAFAKLVKREAAAAKRHKFAWDPEFGYLTPNPAWCGTGLSFRCEAHLFGLYMLKNLDQTIDALDAVRVCCDGRSCQHIKYAGHLVSLENAASLGISDRDLVRRMMAIFDGLATQELNARRKILKDFKTIFDDSIERSLALLKNCRMISKAETVDMLSPLRFAAAIDFIDGISLEFLHKMMFTLFDKITDDENQSDEELDRADTILATHCRSVFKNVKLNAAGRKFLR